MKEHSNTYRAALKEARESFERATARKAQISNELNDLNDQIGRLRRTISSLAALCSESPFMDKFGITDACTEVMEDTPFTLTTAGVVERLESLGFDIASQKNANASVHAVLSRLARSGKITKIEEDGDKVTWRGPKYDPELDNMEIPF